MENTTAEVTFQPVDEIGCFFDLLNTTFFAQIRDFFFQTKLKIEVLSFSKKLMFLERMYLFGVLFTSLARPKVFKLSFMDTILKDRP